MARRKVDPNFKSFQLQMAAEAERVALSLQRLARYPEYQEYLTNLRLLRDSINQSLRVAKNFEEFKYRLGQLDFAEDLIDNSELTIDDTPTTTDKE